MMYHELNSNLDKIPDPYVSKVYYLVDICVLPRTYPVSFAKRCRIRVGK